jgi:TAT (twin-arginine translocation) pathway signal sequence
MKFINRWKASTQDEQVDNLGAIDRITKKIAISISRRGFLKGALAAGAAALGIPFLEIQVAHAAYRCDRSGIPCNCCNGNCATCGNTSSITCYSPNGAYGYYKSCAYECCWPPCINSGYIQAFLRVCNDGWVYNSCSISCG